MPTRRVIFCHGEPLFSTPWTILLGLHFLLPFSADSCWRRRRQEHEAKSLLGVFDLGRADVLLAVVVVNDSSDGSLLTVTAANGFVVGLLVALVMEVVGDSLVSFLDLDGGRARLGFLQSAFGAQDGSLEGDLLLLRFFTCRQFHGQRADSKQHQ